MLGISVETSIYMTLNTVVLRLELSWLCKLRDNIHPPAHTYVGMHYCWRCSTPSPLLAAEDEGYGSSAPSKKTITLPSFVDYEQKPKVPFDVQQKHLSKQVGISRLVPYQLIGYIPCRLQYFQRRVLSIPPRTPDTNTTALNHEATTRTETRAQKQAKAIDDTVLEWPTLQFPEIEKAIVTSAPKKAPGSDRISFSIIQKAVKAIPSVFEEMYVTLFNEGHHPTGWKEAVGIILPKANKPDYSAPEAYRVNSLLNCPGKILKKIITTRLSYLANITNLPDKSQMGGRKRRSAVDAALLLVHHVEEQRWIHGNNDISSTVFLD